MKIRRMISTILGIMGLLLMIRLPSEAATLEGNPHITWAPYGNAFTTDAGERYWTVYDIGYEVTTGTQSTMRALNEGEHYYSKERDGVVPVEKWVVTFRGRCIHNGYPDANNIYYGIDYGKQICTERYKMGWFAYCADCKEPIQILFYMDEDTAISLKELPIGDHYYYTCPHCNNLEQGATIRHECQSISWNQYKVKYWSNSRSASGRMTDSVFMYNNAEIFEGESITPETKLKQNTFIRYGYVFTGWNTEEDGTGKAFSDEQEIFNLTTNNAETINLYAQWERSESTLHINPNGGTYEENTGITSLVQGYGTTYYADPEKIVSPAGYTVAFETNGGAAISPIQSTTHFGSWIMKEPFHGSFVENTYTFSGIGGSVDVLTASYIQDSIVLPTPTNANQSFGGWFEDSACTKPVGFGGDTYTPRWNVTLYAKWVSLVLESEENYTANNRKGAVDLAWSQPDGYQKSYKLYQSGDGSHFEQIYGATESIIKKQTDESYTFKGTEETYTVPYTGFYTLTAEGAQGGSYGSFTGGKGGKVTAKVYLTEGEVLKIKVGGQNGYNGGGAATEYGNGGGATVITSNLKGTLLIAGGGGGASPAGNGGAGGSDIGLSVGQAGASGAAGGGAGYVGGSAGEYIVHKHEGDATLGTGCYTKLHVHTANADYGKYSTTSKGCYTVLTEVDAVCTYRPCNGEEASSIIITSYDSDNRFGYLWQTCSTHPDSFMPRYWQGTLHEDCGQGFIPTGAYRICYGCIIPGQDITLAEVGRRGESGTHTYKKKVYACNSTKYVINCGYEDGQIISSKPGYGGSSYANAAYAVSSFFSPGSKKGNGTASITANAVGYFGNSSLQAVAAPDKAAPDKVNRDSVVYLADGENAVIITFSRPMDNGTRYWYRAESYLAGTESKLCDSNITTNLLTTGISGYYYCIDALPGTTITAANGSMRTTESIRVELKPDGQYLHLAAVDVAGNISETIHLQIDHQSEEVAWKVLTEQMHIQGQDENVYAAGMENTWYVRADGETPVSLDFKATLEHEALPGYQINHMIFATGTDSEENMQRYMVEIPSDVITGGEITYKAGDLKKNMSGQAVLADAAYTVATRSNQCRDMDIVQKFTLPGEYHGVELIVTPVAGVNHKENIVYSVWDEDVRNGIRLIGDGKAPIVYGMEVLEDLKEIDRDNGPVILDMTCEDTESGVREFYMEVTNLDNYITKTFYSDADGHLRVDLTAENDFVFNGDFDVVIHAVDNVGNDTQLRYSTCEFSLNASITRMLEPHEPVFRKGETGILHIKTTGYVDKVELEVIEPFFPEGMIFEYSEPDYYKEENIEFFIPLDTPEKTYIFTVRAYKNGQCIHTYPKMSTIDLAGTVLDDFRRKIIWNE